MRNIHPDEALRSLLFRRFSLGPYVFDFLEGLLVVCITGVGYLLRTPFENGLPHWPYLLAEWYLAVAGAVLVWRLTGSRMRTAGAYGMLLILPTVIADGTILRGGASAGTLLFLCGLLFLISGHTWLFTAVSAALLLKSVSYVGILFACAALWQGRKLKSEQLLLLLAAGGARFVRSYCLWFQADYSVLTFHWPNVYEILGKEAVTGQLIDPAACVGVFLTLGLMLLFLRVLSFGKPCQDITGTFLFFGLAAGYFLPYMDQSCGYLYAVLAVVYLMEHPGEFFVPLMLEIVCFAAYQELFRGGSMMPMALFSAILFLVIAWLGAKLLQEAEVIPLWKRKN